MQINFGLGSHSSPSPLPQRIVVAGRFALSADVAQAATVDKDSFKKVFSSHAGELLFVVANHPADYGLKQHLACWGGSTATGTGPETGVSRPAADTCEQALGITACHSL